MPFPYFGRKARIAGLYPPARFDTIVEPFAGSAGYALHADHWTRHVVLVELDPDIAALWRWLIDPETTAETILALPDLTQGASLDALAEGPALKLMQLSARSEDHRGKRSASEWMANGWPTIRADVAAEVHKLKGWELIEGDYSLAPDVEATWFIDPPYQNISYGYRAARRALDFAELAEWCQARRGQTIVCEEDSADWLPFTPLTATTTLNNTPTVEVWWSNEKVTLF